MIPKEKAIKIIKKLITHPGSVLNTKYSKSHEKVAILYKDHVIEIHNGDEKYIKYMEETIPLNKKEYREIYEMFNQEVESRKESISQKKLRDLENSL